MHILSSLCRTIEPEALKQGNMSSLGFTSKEQRNLGLLVHLMTSNPKILYAPVGTEVDKVILKVRMHRLGPLSFSHQSCSADGLCSREKVECLTQAVPTGSGRWAGVSMAANHPREQEAAASAHCMTFCLTPRPMRPSPLWAMSPTMPRHG